MGGPQGQGGGRADGVPLLTPPMPGHLDVVEGLSLPARYRRGDIGRGGDQEPGNRFFYFLTIFFFSWHARLQCCVRSFFWSCFLSRLHARWPRTSEICCARICDAARSLRQCCGVVLLHRNTRRGQSFLCVRCARRGLGLAVFFGECGSCGARGRLSPHRRNDGFWGGSG